MIYALIREVGIHVIRNSYREGLVVPREVLQDKIERCKVSVRTAPAP